MWPKNAAPLGVLAPSRSKSHRESRGFWLRVARRRESLNVWLLCCPLGFSNKNREAGRAAGVSLYLSNRPVMPATTLGRRHLRGPRGVTHTKAPCASALQDWQPEHRAPHPGRVGRATPQSRDQHPQPSPSTERLSPLPGLRIGLLLACHNPHPRKQAQELGAHRPLRGS